MKGYFSPSIAAFIAVFLVGSFFVAPVLRVQAATYPGWQLAINGQVERPMVLTISDLKALPQTSVDATIYCVDFPQVVVASGKWTGVSLATLLDQAGVQPSAVKVAFYATDNYATDLDLVAATNSGVIVAYAKDGEPLTETLRLVVPGRWGYKWISQLTTITVVDYDFKGKWESQGYPDDALAEASSVIPKIGGIPGFYNSNPSSVPRVQASGSQASNQSTVEPSEGTQSPKPEPETGSLTSVVEPLWVLVAVFVIVGLSSLFLIVRHRRSRPSVNS